MSACEIFFCLRPEKDIASISRVTEDADSGFSLQERTNHSSWQLFFCMSIFCIVNSKYYENNNCCNFVIII